jgi:polysaccharide export outer membrane protein
MRRIVIAAAIVLAACGPVHMGERDTVGRYAYTLGPGDKLKIATYGEPSLTGEFAVNLEGKVAFPLLGDIPARGKTLADFKADLLQRLGTQLLRDPQVSVEMVNFRPVYVLGEVAKPGEFAYGERMSVYGLVAMAGGFTYRANQSYVYIRGEDEIEERPIRLSSATAVHPGDTIRIPERMF